MNDEKKWPNYGYISVPQSEAREKNLKLGKVFKLSSMEPPWLVLHKTARGAYISEPHRRYFVQVQQIIPDTVQIKFGGQVPKTNKYLRMHSAIIVEELNLYDQYGPSGAQVVQLLDQVSVLSCYQAAILGVSRHPDAERTRVQLEEKIGYGTLGIDQYSKNSHFPAASPFGAGYEIHHRLGERATELMGKSAWLTYPDDLEGAELVDFWSTPYSALFDAAIAIGAPEVITSSERQALIHAWSKALN